MGGSNGTVDSRWKSDVVTGKHQLAADFGVMSRFDQILAEVRDKHPRYTVVRKGDSSRFWLFVWKLISLFNKRFMISFATTIGSTTYVPDSFGQWPDYAKWELIRHEAVHVDQAHSWPLGAWAGRLNFPLFSFAYLFLFPFLLTFRAKFEREAYAESLIAKDEVSQLDPEHEVVSLGDTFSSSAYLWMWRRRPAERWVKTTIEAIRAGRLRSRWRS